MTIALPFMGILRPDLQYKNAFGAFLSPSLMLMGKFARRSRNSRVSKNASDII